MSWVVPPSQSSWTAITQVWRSGWRPPISLLCLKRLKATIGTWVVYIHQRALWVQAAAQADRFQQKEGAWPVHIKFPEEVFSDQCEITRAKGCQTQGKGHHQVLLVTVDRWFLRMRTLASHHHDEPTTPLHTKTTPQHHEEAAATRRRKYKEQACFFFFTMASCGTCMRYCAWGRRESRDLRKLSWRAAGGSPVTAIARRQKAISRRRERQRCTKERQREQAEQKRCSSDSVGCRRKHSHKGSEKRKQMIISRWRRQIWRGNSLNIRPERRGALWGWKGKNQQMCARSLRGTVKALDARKGK